MKLLELAQGYKVYVLVGLGALVAIAQYAFGYSFHIPDLPQAKTIGELVQQVWAFALTAGIRSAWAKK